MKENIIYKAGKEINALRKENAELKRLLGIVITDFERVTKMCVGYQCDSCPHYYKGKNGYCEWQYKDEAKKLLKGETVADVQPVVHARWIICSDGYYPYCSECKHEPQGREMTKFCPNCGAKMDGDCL